MQTKQKHECPAFESDNGETVWELIGKVASKGDVKHSFALCELKPKSASMPHYHPASEESYYVTSGQARMVIDGEEQMLKPGMSVLISPNQKHQIFNDSSETLKFSAVCVPAWTPECSVFVKQ